MRCHLWSRGRAVRGRAGMDGDYRGEGCSACHVPYTDDGLSLSRDAAIDRFEPGHPREHRMVRFPDTATCTRCHYGDASIGLSFRGFADLPHDDIVVTAILIFALRCLRRLPPRASMSSGTTSVPIPANSSEAFLALLSFFFFFFQLFLF